MTQDGIAAALSISRAHVALELKRLKTTGKVAERMAHVANARSRRKVYDLTPAGQEIARRMREHAKARAVVLLTPEGRREVAGHEAIEALRRAGLRESEAVQRILSAEVVDFPHPEPKAEAPPSRTFFGRAAERRILADWLAFGSAPVAVVTGVAGIGKSALVANVLAPEARPTYVRRVYAHDDAHGILSSLADFLARQGRRRLKAAIVRPAYDPTEAVAILREDLAGTVVAFDDVHASAAADGLLRSLFERPPSPKVLVLSRTQPAFYERPDVVRGGVLEIRLEGLDEPAAAELLASRGARMDRDDLDRVIAATHGHPLALELFAASGLDAGALETDRYVLDTVLGSARRDRRAAAPARPPRPPASPRRRIPAARSREGVLPAAHDEREPTRRPRPRRGVLGLARRRPRGGVSPDRGRRHGRCRRPPGRGRPGVRGERPRGRPGGVPVAGAPGRPAGRDPRGDADVPREVRRRAARARGDRGPRVAGSPPPRPDPDRADRDPPRSVRGGADGPRRLGGRRVRDGRARTRRRGDAVARRGRAETRRSVGGARPPRGSGRPPPRRLAGEGPRAHGTRRGPDSAGRLARRPHPPHGGRRPGPPRDAGGRDDPDQPGHCAEPGGGRPRRRDVLRSLRRRRDADRRRAIRVVRARERRGQPAPARADGSRRGEGGAGARPRAHDRRSGADVGRSSEPRARLREAQGVGEGGGAPPRVGRDDRAAREPVLARVAVRGARAAVRGARPRDRRGPVAGAGGGPVRAAAGREPGAARDSLTRRRTSHPKAAERVRQQADQMIK